jgi:hypothetical protein
MICTHDMYVRWGTQSIHTRTSVINAHATTHVHVHITKSSARNNQLVVRNMAVAGLHTVYNGQELPRTRTQKGPCCGAHAIRVAGRPHSLRT